MAQPTRAEENLQKRAHELKELEPAYQKARQYVNSEQIKADQIGAYQKMKDLLSSKALTEADANFLVGRLAQIVDDTEAPHQLIAKYQQMERNLRVDLEKAER